MFLHILSSKTVTSSTRKTRFPELGFFSQADIGSDFRDAIVISGWFLNCALCLRFLKQIKRGHTSRTKNVELREENIFKYQTSDTWMLLSEL